MFASLIAYNKHKLTHFRLNKLSQQYILEESDFNVRDVRLFDLAIPREKCPNYLQTLKTLIGHCTMWHLIWVCNICQLPFWGSPD